jgi:hypothetical protein
VGRLFTNTSYHIVAEIIPRSEVGVDRELEEWRVVSMDYVAVGWLVWVTWLVSDIWFQLVHGVVAAGWQVWGTYEVVAAG